MGFIDYSGASFVHTMGGLAGFVGTCLIGPREGLFKRDKKLSYILDDGIFEDEFDRFEAEESHSLHSKYKFTGKKRKNSSSSLSNFDQSSMPARNKYY